MGKTTAGSKKRINKAVDILLQLSPKRWIENKVTGRMEQHTISFITLTIPAQEKHLTAAEGHKLLLANWLLRMKRKHGMTTYIWKAEFQKNGQLHYHITTPSWIHYQSIRDEWNNIMSGAGMLAEWFNVHGSKMPNSTDVHKVYKIKNIQGYLAKYLSKATQDKTTTGKIWDCSQNLKQSKHFSIPISGTDIKITGNVQVKELENCTMIFADKPIELLPEHIQAEYKNHITTLQQKTTNSTTSQ